jgi:hypothetical protein
MTISTGDEKPSLYGLPTLRPLEGDSVISTKQELLRNQLGKRRSISSKEQGKEDEQDSEPRTLV